MKYHQRGYTKLFTEATFSPYSTVFFSLSLVCGFLLSLSSWIVRENTSATMMVLIGVLNKVLTIFLDFTLHPELASTGGFLALCMCIVGASQYRQAPMRREMRESSRRGIFRKISGLSDDNGQNEKKHEDTQAALDINDIIDIDNLDEFLKLEASELGSVVHAEPKLYGAAR